MDAEKMKESENFKCGMVSIIGRPNVGKSTLLNTVLGEKVAIVSRIPQTTRNQVRGVYNDEDGQIIFIDTPGMHKVKDKLDASMNKASTGAVSDVDCLIYLVDTSRNIGEEEENVAQKLKYVKCPIILGLNKLDVKRKNLTPEYIALWERVRGESISEMKNFSMIALSGREKINIEDLVKLVYGYLPKGPALYDRDTVCDIPQRMVIADIVREKLFHILKQEIPHSIGIFIESIQRVKGNTTRISLIIFVEREHQKEIVIGKKGANLKKVGTVARLELAELLETKVFLDIHVKTKKNWRDDINFLQEFGYDLEE